MSPLKIMYGINTNGQGHINRANTIIKQLERDGHQVDTIFSGPDPPKYAKKQTTRYKHVDGWKLVHKSRKVDLIGTFVKNVSTVLNLPQRLRRFIREFNTEGYDLIVTDFDLFSSLTGKLTDTPVLSIDHQHSLIHPRASFPGKADILEKYATLYSVQITTPFKDYYYAIDYIEDPIEIAEGTLHPLIWKDELSAFKPTTGEHITVYLTSYLKEDLIRFFHKFPDQEYRIYGYNEDRTVHNVEMRKTSREGFLRDLTSAKGVIAHSGFSLTWETSMLGKKLWAIPQLRQYEQYVNAYRIVKNKLGMTSMTLNRELYTRFSEFIADEEPHYMRYVTTRQFCDGLYKKIHQLIN